MTREMLAKLDSILGKDKLADKLLISKRGYYFYCRKTTRLPVGIRIHRHDCGNCAWGSGKTKMVGGVRSGTWFGPFKSVALAEKFIRKQFGKIPEGAIVKCSCVK